MTHLRTVFCSEHWNHQNRARKISGLANHWLCCDSNSTGNGDPQLPHVPTRRLADTLHFEWHTHSWNVFQGSELHMRESKQKICLALDSRKRKYKKFQVRKTSYVKHSECIVHLYSDRVWVREIRRAVCYMRYLLTLSGPHSKAF